MADLVRVKEKFQITIPASLRRSIEVRTGDYLEASAFGDGILFRPKHLVDIPKGKSGIVAFLNEPRSNTRTRENIDADIASDRATWGGS